MLSNKIYKHFFLELSKYFFITLFTFTAIVWTVQACTVQTIAVKVNKVMKKYLLNSRKKCLYILLLNIVIIFVYN